MATTDNKKKDADADTDAGVNLTDVTQLDRDEVGAEVADNTGTVSNRVEGTQQREPKPEELPTDALISPVAEQLMPNNKMTIGHITAEQMPDLPGIKDEPDRRLKSDMSKIELPKTSSDSQKEVAKRVEGEAKARPENATREVRSRG